MTQSQLSRLKNDTESALNVEKWHRVSSQGWIFYVTPETRTHLFYVFTKKKQHVCTALLKHHLTWTNACMLNVITNISVPLSYLKICVARKQTYNNYLPKRHRCIIQNPISIQMFHSYRHCTGLVFQRFKITAPIF